MSNHETNPPTGKSSAERAAQVAQAKERLAKTTSSGANANPIVADETYGALREENRVVMRNKIALNLDNFKAANDGFVARPTKEFPPLQPVIAPFMSVIIPTFNGSRFLPTVLDALARQTFQDFETIVIDDASIDDSATVVETDYPHVRLLVNRRNVGFVASCNTAADAASGRVLVLLNNDTEPEATWLEELAKTICAHPKAAVVASKLLLFDDRERLHTAGDMLGSDGIPRNRGVWEVDRGQYDATPTIFSGCGGATAYRRDVWDDLGGLDDDFWMYLEDVDISFRARLAGWEAIFAPNARVYHHLSASGGDTLSSYYVGRNTIWMIAKNMPRRLLLDNAATIVGAQLGIALDALRNIRGEAARNRLRGQLDGLLGLPRQLAKRRVIQGQKRLDSEQLAPLLVDASA